MIEKIFWLPIQFHSSWTPVFYLFVFYSSLVIAKMHNWDVSLVHFVTHWESKKRISFPSLIGLIFLAIFLKFSMYYHCKNDSRTFLKWGISFFLNILNRCTVHCSVSFTVSSSFLSFILLVHFSSPSLFIFRFRFSSHLTIVSSPWHSSFSPLALRWFYVALLKFITDHIIS